MFLTSMFDGISRTFPVLQVVPWIIGGITLIITAVIVFGIYQAIFRTNI